MQIPLPLLLPPQAPGGGGGGGGGNCTDVPPAGNSYSCAQQKAWGKCDVGANPWMAGFCCKTCFGCQPGCGKKTAETASRAGEHITVVKVESNAWSLAFNTKALVCLTLKAQFELDTQFISHV